MKAHPLYLEKFEYSPSLIFPKFSVLIISSLIKASLIKKSVRDEPSYQAGYIYIYTGRGKVRNECLGEKKVRDMTM